MPKRRPAPRTQKSLTLLDPIKVYTAAKREVPALVYAGAVAGLAAVGAIITGFLGFDEAAVIIISGTFIAMVLMYVFAKLIVDPNPNTTAPGKILLYAVIAFFVTFLCFTVTAFALYIPRAWAIFLGISVPVSASAPSQHSSGPVDATPIQPDLQSKRPTRFVIRNVSKELTGNRQQTENDVRFWSRQEEIWTESTPSGERMLHNVVDRISLDGCNGDLTRKQRDHNLEFFIPNSECNNRILFYRRGQSGWQTFGGISEAD